MAEARTSAVPEFPGGQDRRNPTRKFRGASANFLRDYFAGQLGPRPLIADAADPGVALADAELGFDLWSDALGGKPEGKRRFCRDGACIYFEATADSAHHRQSYKFQFDDDQTPRPLSVAASSAAALEGAKQKVQVLLSRPGEGAVFASLADLER